MGTAELATVLAIGLALMWGQGLVYRAERDYYRLRCEIMGRATMDATTVRALHLQRIPETLRLFPHTSATIRNPARGSDPRTVAEADRLLQMAAAVFTSD